jgi:hypothetical protein
MNLAGTSLRATALVAAVGALLVFGPSALASADTPSDGTDSVRITGDEGTGDGTDSVRITGDERTGEGTDSVRITEDAPDNREF